MFHLILPDIMCCLGLPSKARFGLRSLPTESLRISCFRTPGLPASTSEGQENCLWRVARKNNLGHAGGLGLKSELIEALLGSTVMVGIDSFKAAATCRRFLNSSRAPG